ncbi:MAG: hypothetical protein WCB61_08755 [Pseudolabrys sp.]
MPIDCYLKIAAADLMPEGLPDLSDPESQQFYDDVITDAELIVVDNLSTLCRGLKENDADSWVPVQSWALAQRRVGKSVAFIHHGGKSGQQRGTSRKDDVLDTVISLRRPPDYSAEQGCRFELHFEKTRGFHGPDAEPFEARLSGRRTRTSSSIRSPSTTARSSKRFLCISSGLVRPAKKLANRGCVRRMNSGSARTLSA